MESILVLNYCVINHAYTYWHETMAYSYLCVPMH